MVLQQGLRLKTLALRSPLEKLSTSKIATPAQVSLWHIASNDQCAHNVRNRGTSGLAADAQSTRMMLWTAPTLRHQGAIGWLRRNEPLEGCRPWARLARSVSTSRSRFFRFTA